MTSADAMFRQGEYAKASVAYSRACASDRSLRPRCGDGCVRCGDGLAGGSRIAEAIACIQDALAAGTIGPKEYNDACVRWGRAMFDRSQYGEAARCFGASEGAAGGWKGSPAAGAQPC